MLVFARRALTHAEHESHHLLTLEESSQAHTRRRSRACDSPRRGGGECSEMPGVDPRASLASGDGPLVPAWAWAPRSRRPGPAAHAGPCEPQPSADVLLVRRRSAARDQEAAARCPPSALERGRFGNHRWRRARPGPAGRASCGREPSQHSSRAPAGWQLRGRARGWGWRGEVPDGCSSPPGPPSSCLRSTRAFQGRWRDPRPLLAGPGRGCGPERPEHRTGPRTRSLHLLCHFLLRALGASANLWPGRFPQCKEPRLVCGLRTQDAFSFPEAELL